ncbi:MAG: hypothetical protein QXX35_05900 [Desulfurococcaceae archaeon]
MRFQYIINRLLVSIALILIVINISYYVNTSVEKIDSETIDVLSCDIIYRNIDRNTTFDFRGISKTRDRVEKWGYMEGCDEVLIYVYLMIPLRNTDDAIILIHDYGSNYRSLLRIALDLVSRNYIVLLIDLPISTHIQQKVISRDISTSWIYSSICNLVKAITLLKESGLNITSIGLIGIGFGGIVALITSKYDNRVNYTISVAGLGNFKRSVEKGSLINYYISTVDDINPCLDPIFLIQDIDKKTIIILGRQDEVNPIDIPIIENLNSNPNIFITIIPNVNRYRILIEHKDLVYNYLDYVRNNSLVKEDIEILFNRYEILVKPISSSETIVFEKTSYIGFTWREFVLHKNTKKFGSYIVPCEYIISNTRLNIIHSYYVVSGEIGFIIALVFFTTWFIMNKRFILKYLKNSRVVNYVYLVSLILTIFHIYYPTLWFINRFHISLYSFAETYSMLIPFLSYLILLTPIVQTITLCFLYGNVKFNKVFYILFVGLPIFILIFTYMYLILIGTRLYYTVLGIPTFSLIPLSTTTILNHYVTSKPS